MDVPDSNVKIPRAECSPSWMQFAGRKGGLRFVFPLPPVNWYLHISKRHLTQRRKEAKFRQEFDQEARQKASISDDLEIEMQGLMRKNSLGELSALASLRERIYDLYSDPCLE